VIFSSLALFSESFVML